MRLPFTTEQFLDVFVRYNDAVWPAPLGLVVLAIGAVAYSLRDWPRDGRRVSAILAVLWVWPAVVYHFGFFASVTPAAVVFALAFAVQGGLFAWLAMRTSTLSYRPRADAAGVIGAILMMYAVIGYPVVGYLVGHRYPAAPTFGVPCPTTIFTFGLLFWSTGPHARRLAVVPMLWTIVATSATVNFGMIEDVGLIVAAICAVPLIFAPRRSASALSAPTRATRRTSTRQATGPWLCGNSLTDSRCLPDSLSAACNEIPLRNRRRRGGA